MCLSFLYAYHPFESEADNMMEKLNEFMVYLTLMCQFIMTEPAVNAHLIKMVEKTYISLLVIAISGNFSIHPGKVDVSITSRV